MRTIFARNKSPFKILPQIQVTLDCNSACSYCFQKHQSGISDIDTVKIILQKTVSFNNTQSFFSHNNIITVNWHGGEPLLAGIDFFKEVVEFESFFPDVVFENRIQTNGTLMTEELAAFFTEHHFEVGFSLDGPEDIHNLNRRFRRSEKGTFAATICGIETYRRFAKMDRVPVIAVVTRASIGHHRDIFEFFRELNAQVYLNIYDIRCLDIAPYPQERSSVFEFAPSSAEVAQFLIGVFDLWFYDRTRRVDFKEFRNEIKMILQPEVKRGNPYHKKRCDFGRTIFDPSGKVYACDQYINNEEYALGDIRTDPLEEVMEKKEKLWKEIKLHIRKSGDEMSCSGCEWGMLCIGGCITCVKYNSLLLRAKAEGLPADRWFEAELPYPLRDISGETYYCEGLRTFRSHVKESIRMELTNA